MLHEGYQLLVVFLIIINSCSCLNCYDVQHLHVHNFTADAPKEFTDPFGWCESVFATVDVALVLFAIPENIPQFNFISATVSVATNSHATVQLCEINAQNLAASSGQLLLKKCVFQACMPVEDATQPMTLIMALNVSANLQPFNISGSILFTPQFFSRALPVDTDDSDTLILPDGTSLQNDVSIFFYQIGDSENVTVSLSPGYVYSPILRVQDSSCNTVASYIANGTASTWLIPGSAFQKTTTGFLTVSRLNSPNANYSTVFGVRSSAANNPHRKWFERTSTLIVEGGIAGVLLLGVLVGFLWHKGWCQRKRRNYINLANQEA